MNDRTAAPMIEAGERDAWVLPRLTQYAAIAALVAASLLYPLKLQQGMLDKVFAATEASRDSFLSFFIRCFFSFSFSPLTIKEVFTTWFMLLATCLWATWRLTRPRVFGPVPREIWALIAFALWGLVSMVWAPHFGLDAHCSSTGVSLAVWSVFALVLYDLGYSRKFVAMSRWTILIVGLVLMLISLAQATPVLSDFVFRFMTRYAGNYNRNLYGSFIGHNSGLTAACIGPFFFALGGFFLPGGKRRRIFFGVYTALCLYLFIITQTRSAWVQLVILVPLFLAGLRTLIGVGIRLRYLIIGPLVFVLLGLSTLLPERVHFMPGDREDYLVRFRALTPEVLVRGTRLRILVVSSELIANNPIFGNGLASFYPLYPHAQANYFATHPESKLVPVHLQTQRAHNDYLQLLIETGLIGVALALWLVWTLARRVVSRFRAREGREDRMLAYVAIFACVSMLMHATIDFPFHLAPLATLFLFYAVLAIGNWTLSPAPAASAAESDGESDEPPASTKRDRKGRRGSAAKPAPRAAANAPRRPIAGHPRPVWTKGRIAAVVVVWLVALPVCTGAARRLSADMHFSRGSQMAMAADQERKEGMPEDQLLQVLDDSLDLLEKSLQRAPEQFMTRMHLGLCQYQRSLVFARRSRAHETDEPQRAAAEKEKSAEIIQSATAAYLRASQTARRTELAPPEDTAIPELGPRVNGSLLHAIARCYRVGSVLYPENVELKRRNLRALQLAVRYSPSHPQAVEEYLQTVEREGMGKPVDYKQALRVFARYQRPLFLATYLQKGRFLVLQGDYVKAERLFAEMLESLGDKEGSAEILEEIAWLQLQLENYEAFRETIERLSADWPWRTSLPLLRVCELTRMGKFGEAEKRIQEQLANGMPEELYYLAVFGEILRADGRKQDLDNLTRHALTRAGSETKYFAIRARMRRVCFGDVQGALEDYYLAIRGDEPAKVAEPYVYLLRHFAEKEEWDNFDGVLRRGRKAVPDAESLLRQVARSLKASAAPEDERLEE